MKKNLRRNFIFFAMTAVSVLLIVLLLAINGLVLIQFEREANEILDTLVSTKDTDRLMHLPGSGNPFSQPREMDIMRSARYFIVKTDTEGKFYSSYLNQIFYVSNEDAINFTREVLAKSTDSGRIDRYKYRVTTDETYRTVYFLDQTREHLTIKTILIISAFIAFGSWVISWLFVIISSKWFVRPIAAGIEKQKQFITNAGHELKTPLAIIQTNNDAMSLIFGENKYNRNIKNQVIRLSELTANLLMQARLDEEVALVKEHLNISEIAAEVVLPYKDSSEAREITFNCNIEPDVSLHTNRQAFTQLLTVLMDNAMKYTTDKGEVNFSLCQKDKNVLIVEENSCDPDLDIAPERLFERFYRIDNARTQKDQLTGYGIGLSVAKSICESLGGNLTADYPSKGSIRFTAKI